MSSKKNIIIKETIWYTETPDTKKVDWISRPKDETGSYSSVNDIEKAFVFASDSMALTRHHKGISTTEDSHYREFTTEVEWIFTDREETPHWLNGWKTETKTVFIKNGIVKELSL